VDLDARLTVSLCKNIFKNSKEVKTGYKYSKEGCGLKKTRKEGKRKVKLSL
jgi:hypothetical protein